MEIYTQYPDLMEVTDFSYSQYEIPASLQETEFAFAVAGPGCIYTNLKDFKPIRRMRNWWPAHLNEWRTNDLLWWENPYKSIVKPQKAKRASWGGNGNYYEKDKKYTHIFPQETAAGGCGFKLVQPPFGPVKLNRYFGMARVEHKDMGPILGWALRRQGYELLAWGKLASFWVNGWSVEKYTPDVELGYLVNKGYDVLDLAYHNDMTWTSNTYVDKEYGVKRNADR
jgi:hypothetical protein